MTQARRVMAVLLRWPPAGDSVQQGRQQVSSVGQRVRQRIGHLRHELELQSFGPDDDDVIIKRAIDDVQTFYEDQFPKLYGGEFKPISGGEIPYGPDDPPPNCGSPGTANYQDVAKNAFYCPAR